jgi:hypothetical protein
MAASITTSNGCLPQLTATFLYIRDGSLCASWLYRHGGVEQERAQTTDNREVGGYRYWGEAEYSSLDQPS